MELKWGILSAANIAFEQVVPAIKKSPTSKVTAIASKSITKVERFQIQTAYDSYEELLADEKLDSIYIPLPNELHAKYVVKALEAGKHVLVEKPLAVNLEQVEEVIAAQHETEKVVLEAFMYQHHAQHNIVKAFIDKGELGDIKHIKAHFSWQIEDENDIRLKANLGGGALNDVGCYCMHVITQILKFQPSHIHYIKTEGQDVDLTGVCTMVDQYGVTATFVCSMNMPFYDMYEIIGTKGSIRVEHSFRPDLSYDKKGHITIYDENRKIIEEHKIEDDQYLRQIEEFERCINNPDVAKQYLESSIQNMKYIQKAHESLNNRILTGLGE
ncbi:Gfo/Idh/MocA family oxidoreductase [Solibacillus sp. FSL R5-0691]|uniref:Gfo/Idh/MocA family protein n=1 Tax=Solibacillus sp. FSL R5-0691 TaxID=2921653 RepID=UPI0030D41A41